MSSSASSSSSVHIIGASSPRRRPADPVVPLDSDTDDDVTSSGGDALLSSPVAESFASSFRTQESLAALCKKHGVPEQFTQLTAGDLRACSPPPPGAICLYAHALEAGMRVPLHPFFTDVLTHFGVAPSQIAPNGWRAMIGFVVLCHFAGVPASLPVFRHFFSLCAFKLKGWYCFRGKDSAGALFTALPKSVKRWKEGFFFLKSPEPWPCPVKWGEPSKSSTAEPVLTKEEKSITAKLLRAHGTAVDLKTYLCESNLAAAMITGEQMATPPPHSPRTPADAKGIDPSVYDMMKRMRAEKAASAEKVALKSEPRGDRQLLSEKKRKLAEEDDVKPDLRSPPPGFFSAQKKPPIGHVPDKHDGDTADWEAARQLLLGIVTPSRERTFAAARPSDVIASSYVTMLQAANYASFSLGHALELEEKLAAREREAEALQQQLAKAEAELAEAKAAETRNAGEAAVREYLASDEHLRRLAEHALGGYERGLEDMKRAALRKYPHLDPAQLVVPPGGSP